ncbi:hypothetical protein YC2023_018094 [Brassica napus]
MVCPTCHGELDIVRPTRHMASWTRSVEPSHTRSIASWTWSALFAIQQVGRGRGLRINDFEPFCQDELALYRQCAENRDKVLRVRLQESEHKLGMSMPIDLAKERITQLEAKATSLERHLILASGAEGIERFLIYLMECTHGGLRRLRSPLESFRGFKGKIDVQFIAKDIVIFRIENEALHNRTPATLPPLWVDLKSVPSHLFSQVGLKALSKPVGSFIKLHPQMEKCTRLNLARVLIETNLHKPLIEVIKFADRDGSQVKVEVTYPCLPSRCSVCSKWGHKTKECVSRDVVILSKEKEITERILFPFAIAREVDKLVECATKSGSEVSNSQAVESTENVTKKTEVEWNGSSGWLTSSKTFKSSSVLKKFDKSSNKESPVLDTGSSSYAVDKMVISPSRFNLSQLRMKVKTSKRLSKLWRRMK